MSEQTSVDSWDGLLTNYLKADDVPGTLGSEVVVVCIGVDTRESNLDLIVEYNGKKYTFTCNVTNMTFLKKNGIVIPKEAVGKKITLVKSTATNPQLKKEVPTLRISKIE